VASANVDQVRTIETVLAPALEAMGYVLVRVRLLGGRKKTLQIMAERGDGVPMTVEDCAEISRTASAILDVEDPVPGAYDLEVSSPGIDRPLVRLEDFERYAGFEAKVEASVPIDGQRRFRGRLKGTADGRVRMALADREVEIPFADIRDAKLMLTDELIAAAGKGGG